MKNFFALALIAGLISAKSLNQEDKEQRKLEQKEFTEFMKQWGKDFKKEDEKRRHMENWRASKRAVAKLNSNPNSKATFKLNDLADLTPDEKKNRKGMEK